MRERSAPDMLSTQFSALVRKELERQNMSVAELARRLGVTRPVVSRQLNQPGNVASSTVVTYFKVLGMDPDLRTKRQGRTKPPKGAKKNDHNRNR